MIERVTAYRGVDGQLYESEEAARKAEIAAAASFVSGCSATHLIRVMDGQTACDKTNAAILILADRVTSNLELAADRIVNG